VPRGDCNSKGMPPSRNTVWVPPEVPEDVFADNWARAFGSTEGNKSAVSKFERPQGETRHRLKQMDSFGGVK
jgi:hypothetical protein